MEGPHCPSYPTAPPFHFYTDKPTDSDPNPYHHTTDKHTESLHRPAYKEPTSYSSDQVKPASKPEVKPELDYQTDKPPVQEYPPLAYPQEFREGAFSFNVWQNVKEEDETDSDQFPVTLPGCVYNADSCRQHAQSMPSSENMSTERGPFSAAQPAYEDQMRGGQYYGESKSHVIPDSQNHMTEDHLISTGEEFTSQQFQTVNHYTGDPAQEDKLVKIIQVIAQTGVFGKQLCSDMLASLNYESFLCHGKIRIRYIDKFTYSLTIYIYYVHLKHRHGLSNECMLILGMGVHP